MKAQELMTKGNLLTLEVAQMLIGKTIAATSSEYEMNEQHVSEFTVAGIESEWDGAGRRKYPTSEYPTMQAYWQSYMTPEGVERKKNRFSLLNERGERFFICDINSGWYNEPTFFGSDEDRPVYYAV